MRTISAGRVDEITEDGDWAIVDIGFSNKGKTCGLLLKDRDGTFSATTVTFGVLLSELTTRMKTTKRLNLIIEAPLSIAFDEKGNPVGRSFEKEGAETRYWYVGLGCCVLVAATHLLRALNSSRNECDVRLFEGFVSFKKTTGTPAKESPHIRDVKALWNAVQRRETNATNLGLIGIDPSKPAEFESAFKVARMDFGIPPVIVVSNRSTKIYSRN
jgi:hypothetical protein